MLDVCNPQVIRALLDRHGFHFSKAKGQNFLTQRWVPQKIVETSGICQDCGVVEIGPGFGPLTQELCLRAGKVAAIELDTTLGPVLAETVGDLENLELIFGDVMKTDLPALVAERLPGFRPVACANLPYYITSPVLTRLLESRCFTSVTVMVQKEVAQRICARPGAAAYSAFTIFCNYHAAPELLFEVPPSCFIPQPKVTSAVVCLRPPPRSCGDSERSALFPHRPGQLCPAAQDFAQRSGRRLPGAGQGAAGAASGGLRTLSQRARGDLGHCGIRRAVQRPRLLPGESLNIDLAGRTGSLPVLRPFKLIYISIMTGRIIGFRLVFLKRNCPRSFLILDLMVAQSEICRVRQTSSERVAIIFMASIRSSLSFI